MFLNKIMDLKNNPISVVAVCAGCLSSDRKLTQLMGKESKKLFCELLDSFDCINRPISLCWECTALVLKTVLFKRQVKCANEYLIKYMLKQTVLSPLTKLKTSTTETLDSNSTYQEPNSDVSPKIKILTRSSHNNLNSGISNKDDIRCKSSNKFEIEICNKKNLSRQNSVKANETQPLTFIKIESETDLELSGDIQAYYVDESLDNEEFGEEDLDFKAVLNSDIKCESTAKIKSKSQQKRPKATEEDFNESDDEPLNSKKKEHKHKGRRKKKAHGSQSPKIDRRKQPAPKREKPAGVVNNSRVSRKLQQLNVGSDQLEMVVLSWEEVEDERQKALNSVVFTRHEYRCYDCVLGFNHKFKLENHMKKHDPSSGEVVCSVCKVRCRDAHALCAHRRRHRVRWRCCACGVTSSRAAVAADHHARAHGAPPPTHTCTLCGHQETTLGKLRNHIKNHAERQKCELCGKTFRDRTSLRTHLFIHKGEKEYGCPSCGKRFLFKKAMEVHMVTHDAPAHLYCHECDMNFKNRMSYYQHMKYNLKHIDPAKLKYACELCDKKFVKATRLEEHNLAVHLKATPIRCTMHGCNFACSSRPVLRTHIRMVHRNARALRNHVCDTCGKAYTTKKTLEGHMRTHTGERPFKCSQCPSTFGYEAALYNHNKLVHLKAKAGRGRVPPGPPGPPTRSTLAGPPAPATWLPLNIAEQQNTANIT